MAYPPPPVPYSSFGKPARQAGRIAIWVGTVLAVVGLVVLLVGIVFGFRGSLGKVDHFQRVSLEQGSATLTFTAGAYVCYYEAPSLDNGAVVDLAIHDSATGTPIHIGHYGTRLTYGYHGHHGAAVFQFHISQTGRYDVEFSAPDPNLAAGSDVAFGPSIATAIVGGVLIVVAGGLMLAAGIVVLIIGLVRRRGQRRHLATAGPTGSYPGPGYPPAYPYSDHPQQPGYPLPDYQQPPQDS